MADQTPPGPRLDPDPDPRDVEVERSAAELIHFLNAWAVRYQLTVWEYLYLIGVAQHRQVQKMCQVEREQRNKEPQGEQQPT